MMPDKMLHCGDCGQAFEWTERDQEFYESKGYEPPKRCRPCRDKRKKAFAEKSAGSDGSRGGQSRRPAQSGNRR